MVYRSHRKRDLFPEPARGSRPKVQGQRSEQRGLRSDENGFTLIEVIAALIVIAVLAAMIYPVTSGQWRTAKGVGECRELFDLQGQMEEIVRIYKSQLIDGDGAIDLEDFLDTVDGYSYVDSGSTGFLTESGSDLTLTATPTRLLLVTLTTGDQRIANVFAGD